jgi:hypothetical protein
MERDRGDGSMGAGVGCHKQERPAGAGVTEAAVSPEDERLGAERTGSDRRRLRNSLRDKDLPLAM